MTSNQYIKSGVVVLVIFAVIAVIFLKQAGTDTHADPQSSVVNNIQGDEQPASSNLPKMIDLGADKCIPCKKMAPILESMREEFAEQFEVVFIDVWKNSDAGALYGVRVIPTQIFFDENGNELFRHVGFFSREDILNTWRDYGYDFIDQDEPVSESKLQDTPIEAPPPTDSQNTDATSSSENPRIYSADDVKVIAYYFHLTTRCQSCLEIEEYSQAVVLENFQSELEAGLLEWHIHNMELPEHEHFQEEYELTVPSLIVAFVKGEDTLEWKDLEQVWDLLESPQKLEAYVNDEIRDIITRIIPSDS